MSEDRPVTSKDFEKLIKAVQSTNKKLDAQAENSMMGLGGKVKERFKGIGDAIKAPLDNLEGAIKAPFEAVGGAIESVGEAVMKPFESFKNVTQGFKNLMGGDENEEQNSLLAEILEQSKEQTKLLTGNKNREQNQDLQQLEQTKEQQSTFQSIADGVSSLGDVSVPVGGETVQKAGGGFLTNLSGEILGNIGIGALALKSASVAREQEKLSEEQRKKQGVVDKALGGIGSPLAKALGGGTQPAQIAKVAEPMTTFKLEKVTPNESIQGLEAGDAIPFLTPEQAGVDQSKISEGQIDFFGGQDLFGDVILTIEEQKEAVVGALEDGNEAVEDTNQLLLGNDLKRAEERKEFQDTLNKIADKDEEPGGGLPDPDKKGGGFLGGIMGFLGKGIMAIANGATAFTAFVAPLLAKLAAFGKVIGAAFMGLSKLFLPLTVALGVVGAILGGIKGFKEDGIAGMINGILTGIYDMLIGGLAALLGSLVSGFLRILGLDKLADSFQNMLNSVFELIRATIMGPVLIFKGLFTGDFELIKETIANFYKLLFKSIIDIIKYVGRVFITIPMLFVKMQIGIVKTLAKAILGIGIALFNSLKVIFFDLPFFIGESIGKGIFALISLIPKSVIAAMKMAADLFIAGIKNSFGILNKVFFGLPSLLFGKLKDALLNLFGLLGEGIMGAVGKLGKFLLRLPLAVAAGIGALLPGGKSPGEAFTETLMGGEEGGEESGGGETIDGARSDPSKRTGGTQITRPMVDIVQQQKETDYTLAAQAADRSRDNLEQFEAGAGSYQMKEVFTGGDEADPTNYFEQKVYDDPEEQARYKSLIESNNAASNRKFDLGMDILKDKRMGTFQGSMYLDKIQNRVGAQMITDQKESMERAAAAQAFRDRQGERTDRGRVVNAPTKNNVVNTTINEAPKHVDRTTQLFGALPPGMAY